MQQLILSLILLLVTASGALASDLTLQTDEKNVSSSEFRSKLNQMSSRVDESIHTLREQIAESQSAPFLEDLYMQLAELLSQKSNTQYYIEMERLGGEKADGAFTSVVSVQKESIATYQKILKEFPETTKKAQIEYRIALALKSIDEIPGFMKAAKDVIHDYPGTEEAVRTELLLGQFFFEKRDYAEATKNFQSVAATSLTYERDLARYRLGLIELNGEKFQAALDHFEQVITDPDLKEQDNPYSVSLKSKALKTDLKREALVDSVRAYTQLHGKQSGQSGKDILADPVGYYSRIAPSEAHFQEVIEKLAVRYIYLKNFDAAVKLLRSLCERSADPQRIVNIYREVLLMIPISDRAEIPVAEIRFVLEQYHRWRSAFEIPEQTRQEAQAFFEKQVRELATRNHSLAKEAKDDPKADQKKTARYLDHAKDYYLLYLGNFDGTPEEVHMASNLSDVYFAQKDWVRSGEYYLRTYAGEFGAPATGDREHLIDNAVLCLQKDSGNSFYETVRRRGLMIKALDLYIASSEKHRQDPALAFLRAKTRYEQGILPGSLEELYGVAKAFPASPQASQAGEIILDYYNVRNDYDGLSQWSTKLIALNLPDTSFQNTSFNKKLVVIQTQSASKLLSEQVHQVKGYDEFAQGESYLKTALGSKDQAVAQMALQEALLKSKEERDLKTYIQTATVLGDRESDSTKKTEILESVAQENRNVGNYYQSLATLKQMYGDSKLPEAKRKAAFEQSVQTEFLMRNWTDLAELSKNPMWKGISSQTLNQIKQGWLEVLESPITIEPFVASQFMNLNQSDEAMLALYKAQAKLGVSAQAEVAARVGSFCESGGHSSAGVCRWQSLVRLDQEKAAFQARLAQGALTLETVQAFAPDFAKLTQKVQELGSGSPSNLMMDTQLQIALQVRTEELYQSFSAYLHRVAGANAEFSTVLTAKAQESDQAAQSALKTCKSLTSPNTHGDGFCEKSVGISELLKWNGLKSASSGSDSTSGSTGDPDDADIVSLQKKVFSQKSEQGTHEAMLELSQQFLDHSDFHHAMALAAQGLTQHPELAGEFKVVLGCSALGLGYVQEAGFHLKEAKVGDESPELQKLKKKCLEEVSRENI